MGWRKSPASGQDLLLALGYDLRQQGKVGRFGKSWLRWNGRAQEQGQLLPGLGHASALPRSGKGRWEMSDPRNLGHEARENKGTTGMNSKTMKKTMGMETTKHSEADGDSLGQSKELP